jgi:hypothetical protein
MISQAEMQMQMEMQQHQAMVAAEIEELEAFLLLLAAL